MGGDRHGGLGEGADDDVAAGAVAGQFRLEQRPHQERMPVQLGYADLVRYHVAEAVETLRATEGPFDLIFNDITKRDYPASIDVILPKLRRGGVLIIDNLLWSGRILDAADQSPDTEGVRAVTRRIMESSDWVASIVPVRDGVLVAYRT